MTDALDPDTAIALRPIHPFPPSRCSVFEDPADEKSAHGSQRYSGLIGYYRGRDASWYASVTRGLEGADRVLDLGAGPGMAMDAFSEQGVSQVIGVDRWRGFARDGEMAGRRIVLHDLTLPMPFFRSGAFDGIFSHFALDYISPIGVLQVLREAKRLLAPRGRMVLHLAAAGVALGDLARTTPYDEAAFKRLLELAGFTQFEIESPETRRNTSVTVRQDDDAAKDQGPAMDGETLEFQARGELQVSAGIRLKGAPQSGSPVAVEVSDGVSSFEYRPRLPPCGGAAAGTAFLDLSLCTRLVAASAGEFELQAWVWCGSDLVASETVALTMRPSTLRLICRTDACAVEHHDAWSPEVPTLERPGDPYAPLERAAQPHHAEQVWETRPRRVIVERESDDPGELRRVTDTREQFLVRRLDPKTTDVKAFDRAWAAGELHGLDLSLDAACDTESLPFRLWAENRQVLLYVEPACWEDVGPVAERLLGSLRSPALLVDPVLSGHGRVGRGGIPETMLSDLLDRLLPLHLVLAPETAAGAAELCYLHPSRILLAELERPRQASLDGQLVDQATENLRYLTERTTLARLRATSGLSSPASLVGGPADRELHAL